MALLAHNDWLSGLGWGGIISGLSALLAALGGGTAPTSLITIPTVVVGSDLSRATVPMTLIKTLPTKLGGILAKAGAVASVIGGGIALYEWLSKEICKSICYDDPCAFGD